MHAPRRCARRRLALQRDRGLLRRLRPRLQHPGQEVPARLPADRRQRCGELRDDLSRLVPGPNGPHPLQDPDRAGGGLGRRVHLAAVLRRRPQRCGVREAAVQLEGAANDPQRERRHLRRQWRPADAGADAERRRLRGHVRRRRTDRLTPERVIHQKERARQSRTMSPTTPITPSDRTRAVSRLRVLTTRTALAGIAAVGGFGFLAALTYAGDKTATTAVTSTPSTSASNSSTSNSTAATPSPTL